MTLRAHCPPLGFDRRTGYVSLRPPHNAPGLKTLDEALEIRRRALLAYERAEREVDRFRRAPWLTFVVIGGGATGVEMAGPLAEIARQTLRDKLRRFDSRDARVILVEATDRVLRSYPAGPSAKARAQLKRLGVEVRTGVRVTGVDAEGVLLGDPLLPARR